MTKRWLIGLAVAAALTTTSCAAKTLNVIASFTVLADVVKQVGGDRVDVRSLVPVGGDPHSFEPSPDDAKRLRSADLAFISGDGLESWFGRLARAAGLRGAPVVVSRGVETIKGVEDGRTVADPHVWNDPRNVVAWTSVIERALIAADPEGEESFRQNAAVYTVQLRAADQFAHEKIAPISRGKRKILTSHDSFGYFARAYDIAFLSPVGYSTDTEPSAAGVAKLIDQIRREGIKIFFLENASDPRLLKQIAGATGAKAGGTLYVESLSAPDGPAANYIAMFRSNVETLSAAMAR